MTRCRPDTDLSAFATNCWKTSAVAWVIFRVPGFTLLNYRRQKIRRSNFNACVNVLHNSLFISPNWHVREDKLNCRVPFSWTTRGFVLPRCLAFICRSKNWVNCANWTETRRNTRHFHIEYLWREMTEKNAVRVVVKNKLRIARQAVLSVWGILSLCWNFWPF